MKVEEEGEEEGEEEEGEAKVLHSIHDGGARWRSITRGWSGGVKLNFHGGTRLQCPAKNRRWSL